jgi:anthranilate 1,2-dioxygenase large subunit
VQRHRGEGIYFAKTSSLATWKLPTEVHKVAIEWRLLIRQNQGGVAMLQQVRQGLNWPAADFSRIPYGVFSDEKIYQEEQARIFGGPVWNYLALDIELPKPGDFVSTYVGDTKVVVARSDDGTVHAFENSCAHRGTQIVTAIRGNARKFVCPYHLWTFSTKGDLVSVPLERGMKGKGGMPSCFNKADHALKKMRVDNFGGMIFGTWSAETEPLQDFLGPIVCGQIERLLVQRKPKVLGYLRQRIPGNWKLYNENVRDPYHGSLLHLFQVSFGIQQPTMRGGIKLDKDAKNTWNHSIVSTEDAANQGALSAAYEGTGKFAPDIAMADPSLVQVPLDLGDGYKTTILSIFPTAILAQVDNTYAVRHLRPKGPELVELHITYLGFEDDNEKRLADKLKTVNLIGPAGYISLEDGEALRLVQEGIRARPHRHAVVEMGGNGPIVDTDYLSQEISIRGFWSHYARIMGDAAGNVPTTAHKATSGGAVR